MMKKVKLKHLMPDTLNANRGTVRGAGMVERSLSQYGAGRSILVDKEGRIIAGNKTHAAATEIGLDDAVLVESDGTQLVVVKRTDIDLHSPQGRALAIADNRAAEVGLEWNVDALAEIAQDVDLSQFWFDGEIDIPEIDLELGPGDAEGLTDPDSVPDVQEDVVSKTGDLWILGDHRVLCGDSTKADDVARLMDGKKADTCLTDPPYGLGDTASEKNNYDQYVDTEENLHEIIQKFLPIASKVAKVTVVTPGNGNTYKYPTPSWVMAWFTPAGAGRGPWGFCCWQPILCYGKDPKLANGLGCHPDAIVHTESSEKVGHPCSKPINFWIWLMDRTTAAPSALFFDPFLGSGTSVLAAEQTGRKCYGLELSPVYVDIIIRRWQEHTGRTAKLDTGETFADIEAARS
jgi:hypothetical protein